MEKKNNTKNKKTKVMNLLSEIEYSELDIIYGMEKHDYWLCGLCEYKSNMCYFNTIVDYSDYDDENDDYEPLVTVSIYSLNIIEKIKYKFDKWLFEFYVGHHNSFKHPKCKSFYYRNPVWLYKKLFKLYYNKNF